MKIPILCSIWTLAHVVETIDLAAFDGAARTYCGLASNEVYQRFVSVDELGDKKKWCEHCVSAMCDES